MEALVPPADHDGTIELFDLEDRSTKDEPSPEVILTKPAEVTAEEDHTMPNIHMGSSDPDLVRDDVQSGEFSADDIDVREREVLRVEVSAELVESAQSGAGPTGIPVNLGSVVDLTPVDESPRQVVLRDVPDHVEPSVGVRQEDGSIVIDADQVADLHFIVDRDVEVPAFEVTVIVEPVPETATTPTPTPTPAETTPAASTAADRADDDEANELEAARAVEAEAAISDDETPETAVVETEEDTPAGAAKAEAPEVDAAAAAGTEDRAIPLDIGVKSTDADGGDSVEIILSGIPRGAALSAGHDNGDGSWTLSSDDLAGLKLLPPRDFSGSFELRVTASATDTDGGTAATSQLLTVNVSAQADNARVRAGAAEGAEDTAVDLNFAARLTDTDGSETLGVVISGVPDGAILSAGADNGDGSWTLTAEELNGLTLNPPADFSGAFDLQIAATTQDGANTATVVRTATVNVSADADAPVLTVADASGVEDTAVTLDVAASLSDTDGSEILSVVISGVPAGAALSAGTDNGDGSWTLTADELDGLTVTPPTDFFGTFDLNVLASTQDGTTTSSVSDSITVEVSDVIDIVRTGTENSERILGGDDGEAVYAGGGNDRVYTGGGNDLADGGDGRDDLRGGDGDDVVSGGAGNDSLRGDAGADELRGGDGNDRMYVDGDDTVIEGGDGIDRIDVQGTGGVSIGPGASIETAIGNVGDDSFDGSDLTTRATFYGRDGDDALTGGTASDRLYGDGGADTLSGNAGRDDMRGGDGNDVIDGGTGNDTLRGDAGADELRGGDGNDRMYVDGDDTVIEGGDGIDRIDVQGTDGVSIGPGASIETAVGNVGDDSFDGSDLTTRATFYGRDGDDALTGGTASDRLYGDGGADALSGNAGNDDLRGGDGNDVIAGGTGNDTLRGDSGADELRGGDGNDRMYVDGNDTVIEGGAGLDRIDVQGTGGVSIGPGASIETAIGNVGDDSFDGSDLTTRASFYGRDGDDALTGGTANDRLYGDGGADTLSGNAGKDDLRGGDGNDVIDGGTGNDTLRGDAGADELRGGDGNDRMYVDGDDTVIQGGDGTDRIDVQGTGGVSIGAGASIETAVGNVGDDSFDGSDLTTRASFYGRDGDDALTGGTASDRLYGDGGADTLSGNAGNDDLRGGAGNDVITGGIGNDTLRGDAGADQLRGGDGNDRLYVDGDDTVIEGGAGLDRIDVQGTGGVSIGPGASIETAVGNAGDDSFDGSDLNTRASFYGRDGDDALTGGTAGDRLYGDGGNDVLSGNAGNDDLRGGSGNDVVTGGSGNDSLRGDAGADELRGGDGNDRLYVDGDDTVVEGGDGTDRVDVVGTDGVNLDLTDASVEQAFGNAGNDVFDGTGMTARMTSYGRDGDDSITGGDNNDNLRGDGGADTLAGNAGNDYLRGGDGNDDIAGGTGSDQLIGDAGADVLAGGDGTDRLYGGADGDRLSGDAGNDRLYGQDGADTLDGGAGNDILDGGSGDDLFIFGAGNGNDTVHGGDGWLDTARLQGTDGGSPQPGDFEIELSSGTIDEQAGSYVALSEDAAGTVTFNDGSELHFDGLERIEW